MLISKKKENIVTFKFAHDDIVENIEPIDQHWNISLPNKLFKGKVIGLKLIKEDNNLCKYIQVERQPLIPCLIKWFKEDQLKLSS
jgi:hypothetical protein